MVTAAEWEDPLFQLEFLKQAFVGLPLLQSFSDDNAALRIASGFLTIKTMRFNQSSYIHCSADNGKFVTNSRRSGPIVKVAATEELLHPSWAHVDILGLEKSAPSKNGLTLFVGFG